MKLFGRPIKIQDPEDWIKEHYDCPVVDIECVDEGVSLLAKHCTRHKSTMLVDLVEE